MDIQYIVKVYILKTTLCFKTFKIKAIMKQKTLKLLLALSISSMLFYACSDEEELTGYVKSENNSSEEGRFNNITFKWDYHYSTDSVNHDSNENRVYIGDLMQANADQYTNVNTRSGSVTTDRESYGNPGGDGSGRLRC